MVALVDAFTWITHRVRSGDRIPTDHRRSSPGREHRCQVGSIHLAVVVHIGGTSATRLPPCDENRREVRPVHLSVSIEIDEVAFIRIE